MWPDSNSTASKSYPYNAVSRVPLPEGKVIPPDRLLTTIAALTYFTLPLGVILALIDSLMGRGISGTSRWLIGLLIVALLVPMSLLLIRLLTNYGVILTDHGAVVLMLVIDRTEFDGCLAPWDDMKVVRIAGLFGERVWVGGSRQQAMMTPSQARAVLTDSRCPLRGQVPAKAARRLRLA
jgi:hypothetical protein